MVGNRRNFVRFLLGIAALPSLGGLFGFARKTTGYRTTTVCHPKTSQGQKVYSNVDEFWDHFDDKAAKALNDRFLAEGKILALKTELTSSGQAAILTKIYRTKADYLEFRKLWRAHSPHGEIELAHVVHRPSKSHLI